MGRGAGAGVRGGLEGNSFLGVSGENECKGKIGEGWEKSICEAGNRQNNSLFQFQNQNGK